MKYSDLKVLVISYIEAIREKIKEFLIEIGFDEENIFQAWRDSQAKDLVINKQFDLIIGEYSLKCKGDIISFISGLRNYTQKPIIMIMTKKEQEKSGLTTDHCFPIFSPLTKEKLKLAVEHKLFY